MGLKEIRAGLIGLAMIVGLLDGCPIPSGPERPIMQRRISPGAVRVVDEVDRVRRTLLAPFAPIRDLGRLRQRWRLFSGASRDRFRMRIEGRVGAGEWELVYRVLDDDHRLLAPMIESRHVRGAWNPHSVAGKRPGYARFAKWIAREVLAREPRFTEVRVAQEKIVIGARGGYEGTGELIDVESVRR